MQNIRHSHLVQYGQDHSCWARPAAQRPQTKYYTQRDNENGELGLQARFSRHRTDVRGGQVCPFTYYYPVYRTDGNILRRYLPAIWDHRYVVLLTQVSRNALYMFLQQYMNDDAAAAAAAAQLLADHDGNFLLTARAIIEQDVDPHYYIAARGRSTGVIPVSTLYFGGNKLENLVREVQLHVLHYQLFTNLDNRVNQLFAIFEQQQQDPPNLADEEEGDVAADAALDNTDDEVPAALDDDVAPVAEFHAPPAYYWKQRGKLNIVDVKGSLVKRARVMTQTSLFYS